MPHSLYGRPENFSGLFLLRAILLLDKLDMRLIFKCKTSFNNERLESVTFATGKIKIIGAMHADHELTR